MLAATSSDACESSPRFSGGNLRARSLASGMKSSAFVIVLLGLPTVANAFLLARPPLLRAASTHPTKNFEVCFRQFPGNHNCCCVDVSHMGCFALENAGCFASSFHPGGILFDDETNFERTLDISCFCMHACMSPWHLLGADTKVHVAFLAEILHESVTKWDRQGL